MDPKAPTPLFLLLAIFLSCICCSLAGGRGRATTPSSSIARAAAPAAAPPAAAPATAPPAGHRFGGGGGPLDPRQLTALQSMGLPTARDPCSPTAAAGDGNATATATACDSAAPFRHLVALRLADCPPDLDLPTTALRALATLVNLSFSHCPIPAPKRLPSPLASSLRSFSCVASLHRLSGVWLSRLANLTDLAVAGVPVTASGPAVILSQMRHLRSATISAVNLSGVLPHHWHCLNLTHLDLSSNRLKGPVPGSIGVLGSLESLNLSSNALTGALPESIGDLIYLKNATLSHNSLSGGIPTSISALTELVHLDLSSNQFNGSIPRFLSEMKRLRYLNLENNDFQGVIPFNASFIKRLEVFKVGSNSNLCYNHTVLSSKLKLGVAACDKYGLPVSPPPDRSAKSDSSDYSGDGSGDDSGGDGGKGGGGHHGPSKLVLGVAIGLSCLVFLVIFLVCLSKVCG